MADTRTPRPQGRVNDRSGASAAPQVDSAGLVASLAAALDISPEFLEPAAPFAEPTPEPDLRADFRDIPFVPRLAQPNRGEACDALTDSAPAAGPRRKLSLYRTDAAPVDDGRIAQPAPFRADEPAEASLPPSRSAAVTDAMPAPFQAETADALLAPVLTDPGAPIEPTNRRPAARSLRALAASIAADPARFEAAMADAPRHAERGVDAWAPDELGGVDELAYNDATRFDRGAIAPTRPLRSGGRGDGPVPPSGWGPVPAGPDVPHPALPEAPPASTAVPSRPTLLRSVLSAPSSWFARTPQKRHAKPEDPRLSATTPPAPTDAPAAPPAEEASNDDASAPVAAAAAWIAEPLSAAAAQPAANSVATIELQSLPTDPPAPAAEVVEIAAADVGDAAFAAADLEGTQPAAPPTDAAGSAPAGIIAESPPIDPSPVAASADATDAAPIATASADLAPEAVADADPQTQGVAAMAEATPSQPEATVVTPPPPAAEAAPIEGETDSHGEAAPAAPPVPVVATMAEAAPAEPEAVPAAPPLLDVATMAAVISEEMLARPEPIPAELENAPLDPALDAALLDAVRDALGDDRASQPTDDTPTSPLDDLGPDTDAATWEPMSPPAPTPAAPAPVRPQFVDAAFAPSFAPLDAIVATACAWRAATHAIPSLLATTPTPAPAEAPAPAVIVPAQAAVAPTTVDPAPVALAPALVPEAELSAATTALVPLAAPSPAPEADCDPEDAPAPHEPGTALALAPGRTRSRRDEPLPGEPLTFGAARADLLRDLRRAWMGAAFKRQPHALLAARLVPVGARTERIAGTFEVLQAILSELGTVYDVGPETVAVMLPNVALHQAQKVAAAVAAAIDERSAAHPEAPLRIALGISALHREDDPAMAVCLAENCLRVALAAGISKVVTETDPGTRSHLRRG